MRRTAFTLIEVLVIISIIGLLAVLVISGAQAARESARRALCANNLRQLGLALNAYTAVYNAYPRGNSGRGLSLHVALLPELEEIQVFNEINFNTRKLSISCEENCTVSLRSVAVFVCPSDTPRPWFGSPSNNSYAGNQGVGYDRSGHKGDGLFPARKLRSGVTPASVRDGLSQTAAFAEWLREDDVYNIPFRLRDASQVDRFVALCREAQPKLIVAPRKGANWMHGSAGETLYNHLITIGGHTCLNHNYFSQGAWTAASRHGRGAHVAMADGHVRFVKDSLDLSIWRAAGTRAGSDFVLDDL